VDPTRCATPRQIVTTWALSGSLASSPAFVRALLGLLPHRPSGVQSDDGAAAALLPAHALAVLCKVLPAEGKWPPGVLAMPALAPAVLAVLRRSAVEPVAARHAAALLARAPLRQALRPLLTRLGAQAELLAAMRAMAGAGPRHGVVVGQSDDGSRGSGCGGSGGGGGSGSSGGGGGSGGSGGSNNTSADSQSLQACLGCAFSGAVQAASALLVLELEAGPAGDCAASGGGGGSHSLDDRSLAEAVNVLDCFLESEVSRALLLIDGCVCAVVSTGARLACGRA
jgi:hypothetical protein